MVRTESRTPGVSASAAAAESTRPATPSSDAALRATSLPAPNRVRRDPRSSSPHARLGQWIPTTTGRNPPGRASAAARSAVHSAIAATHASYWLRAAGTSPNHPWLITKTSVGASLVSSATSSLAVRPGCSGRSRPDGIERHQVVPLALPVAVSGSHGILRSFSPHASRRCRAARPGSPGRRAPPGRGRRAWPSTARPGRRHRCACPAAGCRRAPRELRGDLGVARGQALHRRPEPDAVHQGQHRAVERRDLGFSPFHRKEQLHARSTWPTKASAPPAGAPSRRCGSRAVNPVSASPPGAVRTARVVGHLRRACAEAGEGEDDLRPDRRVGRELLAARNCALVDRAAAQRARPVLAEQGARQIAVRRPAADAMSGREEEVGRRGACQELSSRVRVAPSPTSVVRSHASATPRSSVIQRLTSRDALRAVGVSPDAWWRRSGAGACEAASSAVPRGRSDATTDAAYAA